MSGKYKVRDSSAIYFITLTIIDWVDLFTRQVYKHLILDSINYCRLNKGLKIYAYVIMTSHIHLIVSCQKEYKLEDTIRDFKKFTSKKLIDHIIKF